MAKDKNSKVMALATVAMALSASMQAIVGFQQFSMNIQKTWTNVLALCVMGILLIVTFGVAWKAFQIQNQQ